MVTTNQRSIANRELTLTDGQRLAYYDSGAGNSESSHRIIVLLHGFCGSSAYWAQVVPLLEGAGRLIIPDLRGHGRSSAPSHSLYGMEAIAGDVAQLLSNIQAGQVSLFGHSLGGYVALAFAEQFPEKLASFSLVHSTAKPDSEEAKANRDKAAHAITTNGIASFVTGLVPKLFAPSHRESMVEQVEWIIDVGYGTDAEGAAATALGMRERPDRTGVLQELQVPRLLIAGAEDAIVPPANTFTADGPQVKQVLLQGSGHMSMVEAPGQLADEIMSFLNSIQ